MNLTEDNRYSRSTGVIDVIAWVHSQERLEESNCQRPVDVGVLVSRKQPELKSMVPLATNLDWLHCAVELELVSGVAITKEPFLTTLNVGARLANLHCGAL